MGQNQSQPGPVNGAPKENGHLKSVHFAEPSTLSTEPSRQSTELKVQTAEMTVTQDSAELSLKSAQLSVQTTELSVQATELSAPAAELSTQITELSTQSTEPSTPTTETPVPIPNIGPEDAVIAVIGLTGVGKSTFISHFSDTAVVGNDLKSCTAGISIHPTCIEGEDVYLVDTPGFDDTNRTDTEILEEIALWLERSYDANIKLAGIVYLHRIQDNRFSGSSTRNIHLFRELCGKDSLGSVVLATTMWDTLPADKAEEREAELKTKGEYWGELVKHGCAVLRQDDGAASATRIIRHILDQRRPVTLQIQEEIAEGMDLHETAAGKVLKEELERQQEMYEAKMALLEGQLKKIATELVNLRDTQADRERKAMEDRERQDKERQEDNEKREMSREMLINELKQELNGLREEVESTKLKQERTEAEYREFTSKKSVWDMCILM
ncbi:GTP-binding protein A [Madurella fahalii]|uniref:GTP-binding protein A n=1 Tax=Madurella fahalii TaxID=1157608 RepID=A0ABQ0GN05_9PEZI